jgi:hypothetical protein
MFMDHNRKVNKAYDPAPEPSRKAKQLAANAPIDQNPEDWRFNPNMSSPEAINSGHYMEDMNSPGVYATSYEDKIPFVGDRPEGADRLKGR